jgi:Domain of unknown function (DUF4372)/Transposase DDE domain
MALIPLGSGRFADDPDTRLGNDAMRHHNSVFDGLLKHLPWGEFDRLVAVRRSDSRVRPLTTKSQLVALLYGQLAGATSLREIVTGLHSHAVRLYPIGTRLPRRSTLADANARRPSAMFGELLALMMARAHRGRRRALAETTYLIDATGLRLDARSRGWARFCKGVCGAKLHVVYDADADRPIDAAITPARVNDITAAQAMPIEPGATYVFDLGYYDYAWWAKLDAAQCRIVTRLKSNTPAGGRRPAGARGWPHPLRPHRPPAGAPGRRPQQSLPRSGARGAPHARSRQDHPHPIQRSRRLGSGDRRSLPAALGDRAVFSDGSSRPSRSPGFSAPARMPCASKSMSR